MDYKKYYFLEDYLLGQVREKFQKRGYLTPEEFFCIIIWKSNRAKTAIKKKLKNIDRDVYRGVKQLTTEIHRASTQEEKLELLLKKWKIRLPIATAILTILYPNDFTVYDVRVRNQLGIDDFSETKYQIHRYFSEYLPKVRATSGSATLRDKDRFLWGKSFYEDLVTFIRGKTNPRG